MPALGLGLCLKLLTGSAHRHAATLTLAGAPHSHHQHASPCIRSERCRRPMHDARPSRGQLLSSYSTPRVIHCAGDPCMTPAPHASVPDTVCRCIPCVYSTLTREGRADACVHRCSVSVLNIQLSLSLSLSSALSRSLSLPVTSTHLARGKTSAMVNVGASWHPIHVSPGASGPLATGPARPTLG